MADKEPAIIYTTPLARLSFPSLITPSKMEGSAGEPRFSATLLFTPADFTPADVERMKAIKRDVVKAMRAKFGDAAFDPTTKRLLPGYLNPVRRGEEKAKMEGYGAGVEFFVAKAKNRPGLVNAIKVNLDPSEFYAGCFVRASVSTWAFDNKSKGVGFNLHNLMKVGDGPAFGNVGPSAEADFGDLSADEMSFDDPASAGDLMAEDDDLAGMI